MWQTVVTFREQQYEEQIGAGENFALNNQSYMFFLQQSQDQGYDNASDSWNRRSLHIPPPSLCLLLQDVLCLNMLHHLWYVIY
jgi:hypothetical protein